MTMGAIIFAFIGLFYMASADIDDSSTAAAIINKISHDIQRPQLLRRLLQSDPVKIFTFSTAKGINVSGEACVDNGYKLVGGGAYTDWQTDNGGGTVLYSSYPKITNNGDTNPTCWFGAAIGKSTNQEAVLTIYAVGFKDTYNSYTVAGWFVKSEKGRKPVATATVGGEGYVLIGGGAHTSDLSGTCSSDGPLLYGSYPSGSNQWIARSRDRGSDVCYHSVTSYVLGLYHYRGSTPQYVNIEIKSINSGDAISWPSASVDVDIASAESYWEPWWIMGGGAYDEHNCGGNFLYAMIPVSNKKWECKGKDHHVVDHGVITCYMIQFHFNPV